MGGFLSLLLPILALLIAFAWGILLGLRKVRIRAIAVAAGFVIALIAAFSTKGTTYADLAVYIDMLAEGSTGVGAELLDFLAHSVKMQELLTAAGGAIVSPLVFAIVFFAVNTAVGVVSYIIFLILTIIGLVGGRKKRPKAPLRVLAYAAVQVILTVTVILTPVVAFTDCIPPVLDALRSEAPEQEPEYADGMNLEQVSSAIEMFDNTPLTVVYRNLGGGALCKSLTTFEVAGEKTDLARECGYIASFLTNLTKMTEVKMENFTAEQTDAIRNLSADFEHSVLLHTVAGEVIYSATDAWLDENGDGTFIGAKKPDMSGESAAVFADVFDHILAAFRNDSRNTEALVADFDTLANVLQILIDDGVMARLGDENTDDMVKSLTAGPTVAHLVAELKKNPSLSILVDDITAIGMRAIGSSINISAEDAAVFETFTDDIAGALNSIRGEGKTPEEQKAALSANVRDAIQKSGTEVNVDDSIMDLYADTLLNSFADKETITPDDVSELFKAYTSGEGNGEGGTLPELPNLGGDPVQP